MVVQQQQQQQRRRHASIVAASLCALSVALLIGVSWPPFRSDTGSDPEEHRTRYLVFFAQPLPQCNHSSVIAEALASRACVSGRSSSSRGMWRVLPRHNAMSAYPSEFAVVEAAPALAECLRQPDTGVIRRVLMDSPLHARTLKRPAIRALESTDEEELLQSAPHSRRLQTHVSQTQSAPSLWELGFRGAGIRVAVMDTGLHESHAHFRNVRDRTNWTEEPGLDDGVGHGSFVAGVIASQQDCPGFAPDAELYIFKVFTSTQTSYTSWFLDAFNYAIHRRVHVLNLSIGGPDFMDEPFTEKILELAAHGILVVSAIGNDGPLFGTLNNPADMMSVLGVGGLDANGGIAPFSSRGITLHELPRGYGRIKPDISALGQNVRGSTAQGGCRLLSGTSVAAPVVAGAVALLASTVPAARRWELVNPASIKQVLVESADRVPGASIVEQGAGQLNLLGAFERLSAYEPRASTFPAAIDSTDCPYMWPYCEHPLYAGAVPLLFNLTVLNGMGVTGVLAAGPFFNATNALGEHLRLRYEHAPVLWPFTGYLAVHVGLDEGAAAADGVAEGVVSFLVASPPLLADPQGSEPRTSWVAVPLRLAVVPPPPRHRRLLFDLTHNLQYPPGYVPRDRLDVQTDLLDWNGDHPHTNFRTLFNQLRAAGFFVELARQPLSCYRLSDYGTLLLVDSELALRPDELDAVQRGVLEHGLGLVVLADWHDEAVMRAIGFHDQNTRSDWTAICAGAHVPALNALLQPFGLAFGSRVYAGSLPDGATFASGAPLVRAPAGAAVLRAALHDQSAAVLRQPAAEARAVAVAATLAVGRGRVAVLGDSSCADDAHAAGPCLPLALELVRFAAGVSDGPRWPVLRTALLDGDASVLEPGAEAVGAAACEAPLT